MNTKLGVWEIGMKVILKQRVTDLGISHMFPRRLGDTWPKRREAYIIGIVPEKRVLVLESAVKTAKGIIDAPTECVRRHLEQPRWVKVSKRKIKEQKKMKAEQAQERKLEIVQPSLKRVMEQREQRELEKGLDEMLRLTTIEEVVQNTAPPVPQVEVSCLIDETTDSEVALAQRILKLMKEKNLGIPKRGITETTITTVWKKFKDRNHKKRVCAKLNKLLRGQTLEPERPIIEVDDEEELFRKVKENECIMYRKIDSINESFLTKLGVKCSRATKQKVVRRINKFLK